MVEFASLAELVEANLARNHPLTPNNASVFTHTYLVFIQPPLIFIIIHKSNRVIGTIKNISKSMIFTRNRPISVLTLHRHGITLPSPFPLLFSPISAGFPSPSDSYIERMLDLNEYCIHNPIATYFVRVDEGWRDFGVVEGDMLVVDRGIEPEHNTLVLADRDGQRRLFRLLIRNHQRELIDDVGQYYVGDENTLIWGTVTYIIRNVRAQ